MTLLCCNDYYFLLTQDIKQQKGGIEKEKTVLGTREQPEDVFSGCPEEGSSSHYFSLMQYLPLIRIRKMIEVT